MKRQRAIIIGGTVLLLVIGLIIFVPSRKKGKGQTREQRDAIKAAKETLQRGDLVQAKKLYKKVMETSSDNEVLKRVQEKIEEINMKIIFSPAMDECSVAYVVRPRDSLSKIAKKFDTTVNLIKRSNGLKSALIKPGQKLKVNICKFSIIVDKSQNILFLKRDDEAIKTYRIATGKNNSTPVGKFKVVNKLVNPTWFRTGAVIPPNSPENILGTRWLGIDTNGYGIHGTNAPNKLGEQVTMGCVRMKDKEVEELFDLVPRGTEVIIID